MARLKFVLIVAFVATVWSGFDNSADAQILRRRQACCEATS